MGIRSFSVLAGISLSAFLLSIHSYGVKPAAQTAADAAKSLATRKVASACQTLENITTLKKKRKLIQAVDQCQLDLFLAAGFQITLKKIKEKHHIENLNKRMQIGFPERAYYCHRKLKMIFEVPQIEHPKSDIPTILGFNRCDNDATVAGYVDLNSKFGSQKGYDMLGICHEDGKTLRCDQKVRWWE